MNASEGRLRIASGRGAPGLAAVLAIGSVLACGARPAAAVTHLNRGDVAPVIALSDLDGKKVSTEALRGRVLVVVFGELYHTRTRQACDQIRAILKDPRMADQPVTSILIVSQNAADEELKAQAAGGAWPATILHDRERKSLAAYQVAVLPSVVVIDAGGKVVHAVAGLPDRFNDVLTDALLLAVGKLSAERFEQTLHPPAATAPSDEHLRADRIASLARQLARRGLDEMAGEKYAEALKLDPQHLPALLGTGELMLKLRRLPDAEKAFRAVLARLPESQEAMIGLGFVQVLRGGDELNEAEQTVRKVLAQSPSQPRAHYLLGLIFEQRHKPEEAAASFKKSAELLMERVEPE